MSIYYGSVLRHILYHAHLVKIYIIILHMYDVSVFFFSLFVFL